MRVGVVFFGGGSRDRVAEIARGLVAGIERHGVPVDLIDGDRDAAGTLTLYDYIAVGSSGTSILGRRIDPRVSEYLSNAGTLVGKKGFAFVARRPIGAQRALQRVMQAMEHEGIVLRYSDVLRNREHASAVGGRLRVSS